MSRSSTPLADSFNWPTLTKNRVGAARQTRCVTNCLCRFRRKGFLL